jgi:hypothetical protein
MALRVQTYASLAVLLGILVGCSGSDDASTSKANGNASPTSCVTGGFSKSLADGTPHPTLVAAVKAVGPTLTNDDLVVLDALDLRQPLGTLLANETFAKIWYATQDLADTCVASPPPVTTRSLVPLDEGAPPTTCPTSDALRSTLDQLRAGAASGDVEGTLATSATQCETTFRDAKPLPSVDGKTPATPVPLATIASDFRREGEALLTAMPATARAFLDLATMLERMQKELITGTGEINAVLQPLGAGFEALEGAENGRVNVEVQAQVSGPPRAFITAQDVKFTRDLGACIGLGGRLGAVLDLHAALRAAACDAGCLTATSALGVETRACTIDTRSTCAPVASDPRNCGGCGVACKSDERCTGGVCKAKSTTTPPINDAIKNGTFDGTLAPWTVVKVTQGEAMIIPTPPGSCPSGRENNSFAVLEVPSIVTEPTREVYLQQTFTVPAAATILELTAWNAFQPVQMTVMVVSGGVETTLESFVPAAVYASVPTDDSAAPCSGSAATTKRYSLASFAGTEVALRLYAKGNDKDDLAALCIDDVKMTK